MKSAGIVCRGIACVLVAVVMFVSGCASSTPVTDAPLEANELIELREMVLGTWKHTHTEDDSGEREEMSSAEISWTFHKDGTGVYHQVVPTIGMDAKKPFKWQLEGRNIRLDLEEGGNTTYYRADDWAADKMKWFNYTMSDYYIVQKQ